MNGRKKFFTYFLSAAVMIPAGLAMSGCAREVIAAVGGAIVTDGSEPSGARGCLRAVPCLLVFLAVRGHIVHAHAVDGMADDARAAVHGVGTIALGHVGQPSILNGMDLVLERSAIHSGAQQVVALARVASESVVASAEIGHLVQPATTLEMEGVVDGCALARCL